METCCIGSRIIIIFFLSQLSQEVRIRCRDYIIIFDQSNPWFPKSLILLPSHSDPHNGQTRLLSLTLQSLQGCPWGWSWCKMQLCMSLLRNLLSALPQLSIEYQIKFKIMTLTFKVLSGLSQYTYGTISSNTSLKELCAHQTNFCWWCPAQGHLLSFNNSQFLFSCGSSLVEHFCKWDQRPVGLASVPQNL